MHIQEEFYSLVRTSIHVLSSKIFAKFLVAVVSRDDVDFANGVSALAL